MLCLFKLIEISFQWKLHEKRNLHENCIVRLAFFDKTHLLSGFFQLSLTFSHILKRSVDSLRNFTFIPSFCVENKPNDKAFVIISNHWIDISSVLGKSLEAETRKTISNRVIKEKIRRVNESVILVLINDSR